MGSGKRGGGADHIYSADVWGWKAYKPNTSVARESAIEALNRRILTEHAANRFKWTGLPDSIDPRFLEMTLFYTGLAIYYHDRDYDKDLAVRGAGAGFVTMYDNPVSFTVIGPGSFKADESAGSPALFMNKVLKAYDPVRHKGDENAKEMCIPIWANYLRQPDMDIVAIYAKRLAWIERTIEINSKNARRNKVLKGSENTRLTNVNINRQIDQGEEVLQVTGPHQDMEFIEALDLGITPDAYEALALLRTRVWNEAMGMLGINNSNQDKKERLVSDEVAANDEQTENTRFFNLQARQYAANNINEVFGTNIEVEYNTTAYATEKADEEAKREASVNKSKGENNGSVHNDAEGRD